MSVYKGENTDPLEVLAGICMLIGAILWSAQGWIK